MKKTVQQILTMLLAALLALALPLTALAAVPERPDNGYVLDSAGVLSEQTEREIVEKNTALFRESGGEIVIVTVDFLGGKEIDDYAYDLFNSWGIGSSERNNGLLLVMAIGEDNYYAMPGYGIEDYFTGGKLQEILDRCVEPDFARGDYDGAALGFFREALNDMDRLTYGDSGAQTGENVVQSYGGSGFANGLSVLARLAARIIITAALAALVISLLKGFHRGGGSGPRGGGGFWTGMLLGSLLNGRRRSRYGAPPPPMGGFGGFGSYGGSRPFRGGGLGGSGRSRGSFGGGFSGGGRSRGGGAGRR